MKVKEANLRPEDREARWDVYSDTKPYQNMTENQRMIFDHAEENGIRGVKRYTKADIARWKENRANMTEETYIKKTGASPVFCVSVCYFV